MDPAWQPSARDDCVHFSAHRCSFRQIHRHQNMAQISSRSQKKTTQQFLVSMHRMFVGSVSCTCHVQTLTGGSCVVFLRQCVRLLLWHCARRATQRHTVDRNVAVSIGKTSDARGRNAPLSFLRLATSHLFLGTCITCCLLLGDAAQPQHVTQ